MSECQKKSRTAYIPSDNFVKGSSTCQFGIKCLTVHKASAIIGPSIYQNVLVDWWALLGQLPKWPNGADCKSAVFDFGGSNPSLPTSNFD